MAFCHHVLVQLSFFATYPNSNYLFEDYALLGDDLVIADKGVAETYLDIIASLGMPYSPDKSIMGVGLAEFAKSLFRHGEDLKPFPLALLSFRVNTYMSDTIALVGELSKRKFRLDFGRLMQLYANSRIRRLATLAVLSPLSVKTCFNDQLHGYEVGNNIFESIVTAKRVRMFSEAEKVFEYTHAFVVNDPTKSKVLGNPCLQIGQEMSERYPVRYLRNEGENLNPEVIVGPNWTAYDPKC